MRLELLLRRMALDWTLSRRQRVDFGAPPRTWEQYSKDERIWDLYIDRIEGEKMRKTHRLWRRSRAGKMDVKQLMLCERSRNVQIITIHEDRWKVLVLFARNGGLFCLALAEKN